MFLKRINSETYYTLKLLVEKYTHLVVFSVKKYCMALAEIYLKICGFHGSLSQKGSRPLVYMLRCSVVTYI